MESVLVLTELPFWGHFLLLAPIQDPLTLNLLPKPERNIMFCWFVFEMFPRLAQIPGLRGPSALT